MNTKEIILSQANIIDDELIAYGKDKFKVELSLLDRLKDKKDGKLILVTSINPTSAGEGKTTTSISLAQGMKQINKNAILALREPSMGPVFGLKGGATGAGKSSIEPSLDIDLHFTGDIHALTSAHNLLSAFIDNHIYFGNELHIKEVMWPRALDVNDRSLREVETKAGKSSFVITAASELMAILALSKNLDDLKTRISNIIIGINENDQFIKVSDLKIEDALTMLLKDAIKPNLVLTTEKALAFVHAGPFANIAHGCSSIIASQMALKLGDYVITEAGFGADLGMEKFLDIKVPVLGKNADLVVMVVTLKALKLHGGVLEENLQLKNIEALLKGVSNLEKHLENIKSYNLDYVIALNLYTNDDKDEKEALLKWAKRNGHEIEISDGYDLGGKGAVDLANLVVKKLEGTSNKKFKELYDVNLDIDIKINIIAKNIYGAKEVTYSKRALRKLELFKEMKYPICMAKTPLSLSGDPLLKARPKDFILHISDIKLSNGAELIIPLTKGINVMPGLNKTPRVLDFHINKEGEVI
ncbi:Formate--tetrahydrofolate ligase (Formyltetrahydrofolate synthetase) [Alteracholeplasma palmae J233]|uniref:Formate--tetrahydrofolate ligase n=1 Tax=Alteracholeplasma palmae (strain ATCC 49389 / J233) TaxID=1318466 RepID=U4KLZ8_ALTPJ|nr:formate--tetrahydrofolate ligase [Alteracholeplasma palmae]CCV64963.1 Formate--tetrahydrofolate ligase (Formyltetrahydrofolate synthetase) [Alteracholeplasma palmae J233]